MILYHKSCRSSKRRLAVTPSPASSSETTDIGVASPVKKTRSNMQLSFDNLLCVFCQQSKRKARVLSFSTTKAQENVTASLTRCQDKVIVGRLQGVDLVAAEVKYHKECYSLFCIGTCSSSNSDGVSRSPDVLDPLVQVYDSMRDDLEKGKAFTVDEMVTKYRTITDDKDRKKFSIERSFMNKFVDNVRRRRRT